jgi:hypothetical protein
VIIFGSFPNFENPNDIDIAIFEKSSENYLSLALKYRKQLRGLSKIIPIDIIPLKDENINDRFLAEIEKGEVIYEKGK